MSASSGSSEKFSVTPRWNWKLISVGLVLLAILIRLGFWQLDRAEEKRQLLSFIEHQQSLPAISFAAVDSTENGEQLAYRQMQMRGEFDSSHYWLVDNKVFRGKVGYEVVAPFFTSDGEAVLVNRGWVAAPPHREVYPAVSFPESEVEIRGRFIPVSNNKMVRNLGSSAMAGQWPIRIQQLAISDAQQALQSESLINRSLPPEILQLSPNDPSALEMVWRDVNVSASKHQGYAVQWFSMAAVLVIALIVANVRVHKKSLSQQMIDGEQPSGADEPQSNNNKKLGIAQKGSA